jgi:hypothetical protein
VLRGRVVCEGGKVVCTGLRCWLCARPAPEGGLRVEVADAISARWQRVDPDVTLLLRAGIRLRTADAGVAARVAREASGLVGAPMSDPDPARAIVRATYPLLAAGVADRLPAVPAALPGQLQAAFRRPRPRDAARLLFGDRATRPVVRALCATLDRRGLPDLFAITVAVAVAPVLQPDHLASLLDGALELTTEERGALSRRQADGLAAVLGPSDPRRVVRLLAAALADDAHRQRLRFIAEERGPGDATLAEVRDWEELALHVAFTTGGRDEVVA